MLLLGTDARSDLRIPWVTASLIALNVVAFSAQLGIGDRLTYGYSLVPEEITRGKDLVRPQWLKVRVPEVVVRRGYPVRTGRTVTEFVQVPQYPGPVPIYLTLFTSMFLHGGYVHLVGNMWFLLIFGSNVEQAMKGGLYLVFYFVCGLAAGLTHVLVDPHSVVPCLGASGAISGVMAAYVSIYPLSNLKVWFGWYFGVVRVPALLGLGVWFLLQYLSGALSILSGEFHGGVAHWAHVGGFLAGLVFVWSLIFHLRAKAAAEPEASEEAEARQPEPVPPAAPAEDPYAAFLPKLPPRPSPAAEQVRR